MLDINFIRQNPEKVKEGCRNKNVNVDISELLKLDKRRREILKEIEELRHQRNIISEKKELSEEEKAKARSLKEKIKIQEGEFKKIEKEFNNLMLLVPNPPFGDVPKGKDESGNLAVKKVGKIPRFKFKLKDYLEIAENFDLLDIKRAAKVSGTRFGYLKREAALMEFGLVNFAVDFLLKKGFIPVIPPVMITPEMALGMGYLEPTSDQETYFVPKDNLYLVATSEQSVGPMHAGEVFKEKDLPKRYVSFSTCFRREAGSYGKDTRGMFRIHQFDKVEMFSFCKPEDSAKEHKFFLAMEEKLMSALKLPYQVVNICTGDLGRPAAAKYDIEAWVPSQKRYRETHSTSNCTDFQARRLNIRYRDKSGKINFVHTVNGTAFSMRPIIPILEIYQRKDGKVNVPKILQKYLGFKIIPRR